MPSSRVCRWRGWDCCVGPDMQHMAPEGTLPSVTATLHWTKDLVITPQLQPQLGRPVVRAPVLG